MTVETVRANNHAALEAVRELWRMYWQSLELPPDFQGFAEELDALPGKYSPPAGCLLLVRVDGQPAGTAAFRPLTGQSCEAKRLFVHPAHRRRGIASALFNKLLEEARAGGYRTVYGDTLRTMQSALDLYHALGFVEVGPYCENPTPDAIYLRLDL